MADLELIVQGRRYGGWKSIQVVRSIESISGKFSLEASDRWADQDIPWPIREEDPCRVEIDGEVVIDGYVEKRRQGLASLGLSYTGTDRSAALVQCSAILNHWSFSGATVLEVAKKVCAPFDIHVSLQAGLKLPKPDKKQVANPGDTPFEIMHTAAKSAEVLLVSDGRGGIVITRAGARRVATPLVQGGDILLDADVEYDATDRFHKYIVATQSSSESYFSSAADVESVTKIFATAIDSGVRRDNRVLLIRPETGLTKAYAQRRADWEARVRAARAETVSVVVLGWHEPGGSLWPVNALVTIRVPRIGINGEMLITEAEHTVDDQGQITKLKLVRPDAFTPEPNAVVGGTGAWKELKDGGLTPEQLAARKKIAGGGK